MTEAQLAQIEGWRVVGYKAGMRIVARLLILLHLLWVEGVGAEDCPSSLNLTTQAQIDSLPTLYEHCQNFISISIGGDDIINLDGLFIVEQVNRLGIYSSSLLDISGLHNLKFVWQWLELIASNLSSLEGLQNARFFGALKVEAPIETSPPLNANGAYFIELDGTRLANLDALAGVTEMQSSGIVLFGSPGIHIYNNLTLSDCSAVAPLLGWPNMPYSSETDLIDDSIYVGHANFVSNGVGANSPDDCLNAYSAKDNDGDGVQNISDNCISVANTDQNDNDGDGAGDTCDTDDDNDGIHDEVDLYPLIPIGDLLDADADGAPDECDEACQALGMEVDIGLDCYDMWTPVYSQEDANVGSSIWSPSDCNEIPGLFTIGGEDVERLLGISSLRSIKSSFVISGNSILQSLNGLESVVRVYEDLEVRDNPALADCRALAPLLLGKEVDGYGVGGSIIFESNAEGCNSAAEVLASVEGPSKPSVESVVVSDRQFVITFNPSFPAEDIFPVTGYEAICTSDGGVIQRQGVESPIRLTGAIPGKTYACTVAPITKLGTTPVSDPYTVTVPLELPSVPTITSTDYEDGKIILTVSVTDNGGTDITGYEATCTDGTNTYTGTSTSSPITVSGLTNDVAYTCTVTATNSVGTSSASAATASITPEEASTGLPIWLLYQATQ